MITKKIKSPFQISLAVTKFCICWVPLFFMGKAEDYFEVGKGIFKKMTINYINTWEQTE